MKKFKIETIDLTEKKPKSVGNKSAEEKSTTNDDEMDIYEDVMKLEIKVEPLVQPIVLSDEEDDGSSKDATEKVIHTKESTKITEAPLKTNGQEGEKNGDNNTTCSKEKEGPSVVSKSEDAVSSTSASNEIEEESDDENMVIDEDVDSTARTRIYVKKRKIKDDETNNEMSMPPKKKSSTTEVPTMPGHNDQKTQNLQPAQESSNEVLQHEKPPNGIQEPLKLSSEKQPPQNSSSEVQQPGKTPGEIQETKKSSEIQPPKTSSSEVEQPRKASSEVEEPKKLSSEIPKVEQSTARLSRDESSDQAVTKPTQKPRRRLIGVSAASIAAGVLSGLGVSAGGSNPKAAGLYVFLLCGV